MRVTDAIAQQIKASGGASCNKREFALLAADLLDARNRITELEAQLAEARKDGERLKSESIPKDDFMLWALDWRNIQPDEACKDCGGSGAKTYGNTSTWHGGIGGRAMTSDVCDQC